MKRSLLFIALLATTGLLSAQISAKLMRYFDVSQDQITFVYGGDLWVVPKTGGTAIQVTHSPGEESYPHFSPDGKTIAYTAAYNGNLDVYTIPVTGGVPQRITYQAHADRMVSWHPNGEQLLFASRRELGQRSSRQFFLVDKDGGFPQRLPLPYGELASYSPDGNKLAYITKITENYPFKRYRGGLTSDILIYDTQTQKVTNVTNNTANDGQPAWTKNKLYFLSDQAADMRLNIWSHDPASGENKQITRFKDFDISRMSAGPNDLIFEVGGTLYLMDLATEKYAPVNINVVSDLSVEMARAVDVSDRISGMTAAPGGKRVVFEARGELFDVPAKEGFTINLTQSSGAFDQNPAWSPDGKSIAYWSDRSGEYEIYIQAANSDAAPRKLTSRGKGLGYTLNWSPDSKHIAFVDETNTIFLVDAASGATQRVARYEWNIGHGGRNGYTLSWSQNSEWLAFHLGQDNGNDAIFCYNTRTKALHQVTSGYYNDFDPVFSVDGKYLFFLTNRSLTPAYSDMGDGTWVYPNATQVAAISLTKDAPSLLAARNDEVEVEEDKEEKKEGEEEEKEGEDEKEEEKDDSIAIDFEDMESRLVILPPDAGNIGGLMPFKGKLVYVRIPNTGSGDRNVKLVVYDLKEREEKPVIENINGARVSADGKSILVSSRGKYGIIKPAPGQKLEEPVPTDGLVMNLVPKEEWRQIFNDTWRRHRDFFYDPNMHGLDWEKLRDRYGALIEDARTRWDVSAIQSNLAAELSAGHTYTFGGDNERVRPSNTGYLGIDWELKDGTYRIARIVRPAAWDTEVRSPLDRPGVDIKAGDEILSVNGRKLSADQAPYAAFEGLAGETVSLKVRRNGETTAHVISCLNTGQETRLRHLEWIEQNRQMVDRLSGGKLGYVYMSNTAGQGQLELVRMYYGQLAKEGFIIDERFNGGGQLADRFLELLQRPVVYNLHWRHGKDHTHPIKTNTGPVGMLINGWAGSGGDGLPWAFQELEAGPIVGERTLGILVGPATGHRLIDGGGITVPGARLYDNDGHWFWEGEGVSPDIKVWDDPNLLMQGRDPQMERVVEEVLKLLETNPPMRTPAPPAEDRTAKGLGKG